MEYSVFLEKLAKHGFDEKDAKQGGAVPGFGSGRDLKAGVEHINEDEEPIAIAGGEFFYSGAGTPGVNNAVLILTKERLLKVDKKITNVDIQTFFIDDIQSSMFKSAFLHSKLVIKTASAKISVDKVRKETGRKFNDKLNELIRNHKKEMKNGRGVASVSNTTVQNELSPMEEIKKGKELLDAGIITEDEFNELKKKHL